MTRLKPEDLEGIKEKTLKELALREGGTTIKITVHMGTCGLAAGAKEVMEALTEELAASGRKDIRVVGSGCMGMCSSVGRCKVTIINVLDGCGKYCRVSSNAIYIKKKLSSWRRTCLTILERRFLGSKNRKRKGTPPLLSLLWLYWLCCAVVVSSPQAPGISGLMGIPGLIRMASLPGN